MVWVAGRRCWYAARPGHRHARVLPLVFRGVVVLVVFCLFLFVGCAGMFNLLRTAVLLTVRRDGGCLCTAWLSYDEVRSRYFSGRRVTTLDRNNSYWLLRYRSSCFSDGTAWSIGVGSKI